MTYETHELFVDTRRPAVVGAVHRLIIPTIDLLEKYAYPDELSLAFSHTNSIHDAPCLKMPAGAEPYFMAERTDADTYEVTTRLPFPSRVVQAGINHAAYSLRLPPTGMIGGSMRMRNTVGRTMKHEKIRDSQICAEAAINGIANTLNELRIGRPIQDYEYHFKALGVGKGSVWQQTET